jgi:hypothetical protein
LNIRRRTQQIAFLVLVMSFLVGCGTSQATPILLPEATPLPEPTDIPPELTATQVESTAMPVPPTKTPNPTSCQEVAGNCLELSFDGETCTYKGPTDIKPGSVTLLLLNESEGGAAAGMVRLKDDKTIQDVKDIFVEEPITEHGTPWTIPINWPWRGVPPGESYVWEGILEPGIHTLVCARITPYGVGFGAGFTVQE